MVAGRVLGINPFDQPDVTGSEANTRRLLDAGLPEEPPLATIGAVELRAPGGLLDGVDSPSTTAWRWPSRRCWPRSRRGATSR